MNNKTTINLKGRSYPITLVDKSVVRAGTSNYGHLFRILDDKGNTLGCLTTYISHTTKAIWGNEYGKITDELLVNLFLRIIPHVPFEVGIDDFTKIYSSCIALVIDTDSTYYDKANKTQYIRSYGSPKELVDDVVFGNSPSDEMIQQDILTYLYNVHLENHEVYTPTLTLAKALFIDANIIYRCLNYLYDDGYIKGEKAIGIPGFVLTILTTQGARYIKNNFHQLKAGTEVTIMGDFVGNDKILTNTQGNNNQNVVKSVVVNSFNISEVINKLDEFKKSIEEKYEGVDKPLLLTQVEEVKTLASSKNNFPKIRSILGSVLTKTSEVAQIAALGIELYKIFTIGG